MPADKTDTARDAEKRARGYPDEALITILGDHADAAQRAGHVYKAASLREVAQRFARLTRARG